MTKAPMPRRDQVHPDFDGHPERALTPSETIDWIWECMQLLRLGQEARQAASKGSERGSVG